jgi:hypothetical protein
VKVYVERRIFIEREKILTPAPLLIQGRIK